VYFDRSEEAQCTRLAALSQAVPAGTDTRSPSSIEAQATSLLASGNCMRLRARFSEADQRLAEAAALAQQLPKPSADRQRLLILAAVGRGRTALSRYQSAEAARALKTAEQELASANSHALDSAERTGLRVVAASLESDLAQTKDERIAALDKATKLLRAIPATQRESGHWRSRQVVLDLDRAWALNNAGQQADADDLGRKTLASLNALLEIDPTHVTRQALRLYGLRLRADIQSNWGRKQASLAILNECRQLSGAIARQEPGLSQGAYLQNVAAWQMATQSDQPVADKRAQLKEALGLLERLVRDAPDYTAARRSIAILHGALGKLSDDESKETKRPEAERQTLKEAAMAHYGSALKALTALSYASMHPDVGDLNSSIEISIGDLELSRKNPSEGLAAFQRAAQWRRGVSATDKFKAERVNDDVIVQQRIARALRQLGKASEADAVDKETLSVLGEMRLAQPEEFAAIELQAWTHRMAASNQLQSGDLKAAVTSQLAAAELLFGALKRDPLSKPAEDSLKAVIDFARDSIWPPVVKTEDAALRARLLTIFSYRVAQSQPAARPRSPLLPGNWEHHHVDRLPPGQLGIAGEAQKLRSMGWMIVGVRRLALQFYEQAHLVELDLRKANGELATAAYVVQPDRDPVVLTGASKVLQDLNQAQNLDLSTATQAGQYVRFYFWACRFERWRIRPIEQLSDLMWHPDSAVDRRIPAETRIEPLELQRSAAGDWVAQGTVQYGAKLYQVKVTLNRNGNVAVPRETTVDDRELALVTETYRDSLRVLDDSVARPALLQQFAQQASSKRDWKAAASHQDALVTYQLKALTEPQIKDTLPGLYLALSWYQLLNAEPDKALKSSDAGLALQADSLSLQTNRAHALLLLGREKEALGLYRSHIGKVIQNSRKPLWQDEILDDLKAFDQLGLKDPRFAAVRQMMEAAKK